jgi:hypothetical protein
MLEQILKHPENSTIYLERYVNKGSPSGFTKKSDLLPEHDPFNDSPGFFLPLIKSETISIGKLPLNESLLPVHPEMIQNSMTITDKIFVVPTSSGRTVFAPNLNKYIKLHYSKTLGRAPRELTLKRIKRSIYVSTILENNAHSLLFLPEEGGIYSEKHEIGAIYRDSVTKPLASFAKIPFFSLFSEDKHSERDPLILNQILSISDNYAKLIKSIIGFYIDSALRNNLLFEPHAQNLLLAVNKNGTITGTIIRDYLDCVINDTKSKHPDYASVVEPEDPLSSCYNSFCFDFKLGEYVLKPIEETCKHTHPNFSQDFKEELYDSLKKTGLLSKFQERLPANTYCYPNTTQLRINGKPNFIKGHEPKYR